MVKADNAEAAEKIAKSCESDVLENERDWDYSATSAMISVGKGERKLYLPYGWERTMIPYGTQDETINDILGEEGK